MSGSLINFPSLKIPSYPNSAVGYLDIILNDDIKETEQRASPRNPNDDKFDKSLN